MLVRSTNDEMISVEEATLRILDQVHVLPPERKSPLDALGQVLAEDVVADFDIPPLDNSAMDGYAVRAEDTAGATKDTPRVLRVIGELPAGTIAHLAVTKGTAVRIMTGAPVPRGADAVVRFEETSEGLSGRNASGQIAVLKEARSGLNIRRAGEDVRGGQVVLPKGTVLRPAEVGVLASLGRTVVAVVRHPQVAILATGDELVEIGEPLQPGKIYNSNSYSTAAQVARYGGIPVVLGIARDNTRDLVAKVRQGLSADLIITSGGVSVGDFDIVKDVLAAEGEITFWRVRMKPGKPLAFGKIRGVPHLGLPGNPVSSMVSFEQFARPAILKMLGKTKLRKPEVEAILEGTADNTDGRRVFLRAWVEKRQGQYYAALTGPQGSGILTSMALANGLVIMPEDTPHLHAGARVRVQMLDWPEEE